MDLNAGQITRQICSRFKQWTNVPMKNTGCHYFPPGLQLPSEPLRGQKARLCEKCQHHRITNQQPLSCIIKSHRLTFFGHLAWMDEKQILAKATSNLLQRTGSDHPGGRTQLGWRTFMMTCLRWILGYIRLEIQHKIGLSADRCLHSTMHL